MSVGQRLVQEFTVGTIIFLNAGVLFLDAFPGIHDQYGPLLFWVDYGCLLYFILEAGLKIRFAGSFRSYWSDGWNVADFVIVAGSLPLLITPFLSGGLEDLGMILLLRLGRLLRFLRPLRLIPNAEHIWKGIGRALRASVGVLVLLMLLNLIFAMGGTLLFGSMPEAAGHFGDPFRSLYSIFKVFTIEGWHEIPEQIAANGAPESQLTLLRLYFTAAVLTGGLFGLSIANAVFVDSMVEDNTEDLEKAVEDLHQELRDLREELREARAGTREP